MHDSSKGRLLLPGSLAVLMVLSGCDEGKAPNSPPAQPNPETQATISPPNAQPAGNSADAGAAPGLKGIMIRIGRGPQALNQSLGQELKGDQPPWETIQPQAKEYAKLASEMGQYDPPKGEKESWGKLTAEFVEAATELDHAAQVKDKEAALAAQGTLSNSCMACHRQHRVMGPGGRRGGSGGGFGAPPGGGPPGSPPQPGGPAPQ